MEIIVYLAIAIVVAIAAGHLIKWLLEWLLASHLTEREAAIAAFCTVLGNGLGFLILDFSFDAISVVEKLGSVIGLSVLWWSLFKRKKAHG